jgi:hypothetical protein
MMKGSMMKVSVVGGSMMKVSWARVSGARVSGARGYGTHLQVPPPSHRHRIWAIAQLQTAQQQTGGLLIWAVR